MPTSGDDAMDYSGLHALLDQLAEAIHAFGDQLAEQEQLLGSLIDDNSRTWATRPFRDLNPGGGSTRTQSVFMDPESMSRPGDGSAMQSPAGMNERQETHQSRERLLRQLRTRHEWLARIRSIRHESQRGAPSLLKAVASLNVLIIEDNAMIAMLYEELLIQNGHHVCGTAKQRMKLWPWRRACNPDLIIADLGLRQGSGRAAVQRILQSRDVRCSS